MLASDQNLALWVAGMPDVMAIGFLKCESVGGNGGAILEGV